LDQTEDKLASAEADIARLQTDLARVTAAEHSVRKELCDAKSQHAELEADLRNTVKLQMRSDTIIEAIGACFYALDLRNSRSKHPFLSSMQMKENEDRAAKCAEVAAAQCAAHGWLQRQVLVSTRSRLEAALAEAQARGEVHIHLIFIARIHSCGLHLPGQVHFSLSLCILLPKSIRNLRDACAKRRRK